MSAGKSSGLNTTFVDGSRAQKTLRVSYEPGPSAFNFAQLSGGSIAEMLDQAATRSDWAARQPHARRVARMTKRLAPTGARQERRPQGRGLDEGVRR